MTFGFCTVMFCGGGRIRTSDAVSHIPVFETGAFDHSATPPMLTILAFRGGNDKVLRRPYRLTARTAPFHGVNRGSIPRRVTRLRNVRVFSSCGFFRQETKERWQSGRMHWFRKPAGAKAPRGFKSHPLRICIFGWDLKAGARRARGGVAEFSSRKISVTDSLESNPFCEQN